MTTKSVSRFTGLLLTLAITLTTSGWIPFTAPVTIETDPAGAEVFEAGSETPLGVTPYYTRVFLRDKQLEVRMDKFYTEELVLDHKSPETISLTLTPTPVVVYTKPAADVVDADGTVVASDGASEIEVLREDKNYAVTAQDYFPQEVTIGLSTDNPQIIELKHRPLLSISTVQSGVDIYENGSFFAKAPVTKEEISSPRTFEFRKDGFFKKSLSVTPAQTHEMAYTTTVALEPLPVITIKATPADAEIYMVGKSDALGTGSVELMIEKETSFEVKADRYYSKPVTADLRTQTLTVDLKAMPYVTIKSAPSGAAVSVDGKAVGTTPVEQLIEKSVAVELTKEGYFPQTATLDGSDLSPMISLKEIPPPPVITIASVPVGASVSVDGKAVGVTPVEQVVEKPITVVVTMEDYHSQTVTFDGSNLTPSVTLTKKTFWEKLTGK